MSVKNHYAEICIIYVTPVIYHFWPFLFLSLENIANYTKKIFNVFQLFNFKFKQKPLKK